MVEIIMGKIIGHNKTVILVMFLFILVLFSSASMAAFQEGDLFEKAYEYYLSYHPEKALEYFDIFLYNFPDSSAKDAVLFWKAKSLMQLKRADEAIKIFTMIKEAFPGSPFIPFIEKEISTYKNDSYVLRNNDMPIEKKAITSSTGKTIGEEKIIELERGKAVLEGQLAEINKLKQLTEKGLSEAIEDKNRLEALLEESRKNNEDLSRKIAAIESDKTAENKSQNYNQIEADIKNLRSERDDLKKKINELENKNKEIEILKAKTDEQENQYRKTTVYLQQLKEQKESLEKGIGEKDRKIAESEKAIALLNEKVKEAENERTREKQDASQTLSRLSSEKVSIENELKNRQGRIEELTVKAEEQARERQASEVLLKKLTAEKAAAEEKLKGNKIRLAALEEELKKERSRMADLSDKGDRTEMLAKELRESEEIKKKLQKQIDQYNEQIGIRAKEKETLLAKLKEAEGAAKNNADSLQKLKEDYASAKKTYDSFLVREKSAIGKINSMKGMIKQYETPIVKLGRNQFSLRQILDDFRVSSEVMKKIKATHIVWRHDNPYNDFIIEQTLLMKANKSGIKEDRDLYNSLLAKYSLNDEEKGYLVRYLTIHNLVKKKLSEIVADENYTRKYYELNKERYFINTTKKQVKILSLNFSPKDELEKSLVAIDFYQEVASGKTFESVYKTNANVLSFDTVNLTNIPDFIHKKIDRMKDGEISNVISHGNKFMILQMQFKQPGYQRYEDVYKEIQEKIYEDQTLQANLLQEWFDELRKEAESIK